MTKKLKTEHAGAKNSGGHWGTRHEAKRLAKKLRRMGSKAMIKKETNQMN